MSALLGTAGTLPTLTLAAAFADILHTKLTQETVLALLALQDLALLVGSPTPLALRLVFAGATQ